MAQPNQNYGLRTRNRRELNTPLSRVSGTQAPQANQVAQRTAPASSPRNQARSSFQSDSLLLENARQGYGQWDTTTRRSFRVLLREYFDRLERLETVVRVIIEGQTDDEESETEPDEDSD